MSNSQIDLTGFPGQRLDAWILPTDFGDFLTVSLELGNQETKSIDEADGYPSAFVPTIVAFVVQNDTDYTFRYGGADLEAEPTSGLEFAEKISATEPRFLQLAGDPGKLYIHNPNSDTVTLKILLVGKVRAS